LKYDGDERWKADKAFHFYGCLKFEYCAEGNLVRDRQCHGELGYTKPGLDSIMKDVIAAVAQCKEKKGISTRSSALTVPKGKPAFQDTFQRKKHPSKPSTKSGNYLSTPSGTTSRRATLPKGSNTSGNDLANPSGGTARRAADPCLSPTAEKPCKPAATILGTGLLDSGPVFSPRGPTPAGTPMPPGGSAAPTIGGSTRVR
jgi:hypothetical protein